MNLIKVVDGYAPRLLRANPSEEIQPYIGPLQSPECPSLLPFVKESIEPGTTVITDGWNGYQGIEGEGYVRDRRSQRAAVARGEDPGELLPAVHRIAALAKRWILGTHQGAVDAAHLPSYLNEFVFRFNRRHSRSRGMLLNDRSAAGDGRIGSPVDKDG